MAKINSHNEHKLKKAKALAAMDLVEFYGQDEFKVGSGTLDGVKYTVGKDEKGVPYCDCKNQQSAVVPGYRCEHILAVGHALNNLKEKVMPKAKSKEFISEAEANRQADEIFGPAPEPVREPEPEPVPEEETQVNSDAWYDTFSTPLPAHLIKQREGWTNRSTGQLVMVDYIEWSTVVRILNKIIGPAWDFTVTVPQVIGGQAVCKATIVINYKDEDGCLIRLVREGIGTGAPDSEMGLKKAEHDALKRAAVKLGLGLELYSKAETEEAYLNASGTRNASFATPEPQQQDQGFYQPQRQQPRGGGGQRNFPKQQLAPGETGAARSEADLASQKQIGLIKASCRNIGEDPYEFCEQEVGCSLNDLSKKGASVLIDRIKAREQTW